jgi:CRISPR-associated protein Csx17
VLIALADIEDVMASGAGFGAGPIPPLQPRWIEAANDGTSELHLAVALGLAVEIYKENGRTQIDPVRRHAIPFDNGRFNTASEGLKSRLVRDSEVVMTGRDPAGDCIALVTRRLIESTQSGSRRLPLEATFRADAHPSDLARLIAGGVDLDRTLRLARAFMAIDAKKWVDHRHALPLPEKPDRDQRPDDGWIAIRLALLPWTLEKAKPDADVSFPGADPAIFRLLESGDGNAPRAVELAVRRLRAKGIAIPFLTASVNPDASRLWAAALAFPISKNTAITLCTRVLPTQKESAHA